MKHTDTKVDTWAIKMSFRYVNNFVKWMPPVAPSGVTWYTWQSRCTIFRMLSACGSGLTLDNATVSVAVRVPPPTLPLLWFANTGAVRCNKNETSQSRYPVVIRGLFYSGWLPVSFFFFFRGSFFNRHSCFAVCHSTIAWKLEPWQSFTHCGRLELESQSKSVSRNFFFFNTWVQ